jgi:hypothetical protein
MLGKMIAVITVLFGAGLLFSFISPIPDAKATVARVSAHAERTEGDLPGFLRGPACSASAWPNYDASCLFDMRPESDARKIRIIVRR